MSACLNCGNTFSGDYCSSCGQKELKGKTTLKNIFSEFIQTVFLIDSPIYKTLVGLLYKPGHIVKSYIAGKRKTYMSPFHFFLLFTTIYLIVFNYIENNIFNIIISSNQFDSPTGVKTEDIEYARSLAIKNLNIFFFILVPIIAFYIKVFFKKAKYNYPETLIFSLYIMGINFFLCTIIDLFSMVDSRIFLLRLAIVLGYFPFAIIQFTNSKIFSGLLKSILTIILSYFSYAIILTIIINIFILL